MTHVTFTVAVTHSSCPSAQVTLSGFWHDTEKLQKSLINKPFNTSYLKSMTVQQKTYW